MVHHASSLSESPSVVPSAARSLVSQRLANSQPSASSKETAVRYCVVPSLSLFEVTSMSYLTQRSGLDPFVKPCSNRSSMRRRLTRWLGISAACIASLALVACGGKQGVRSSTDQVPGAAGEGGSENSLGGTGAVTSQAGIGAAGAPEASMCMTPTADDYQPAWMPPKADPGACSSDQLAQAYALCEDRASYEPNACRAFNEDAANGRCLGCLYGTLDGKESAALFVLDDGDRLPNIGGCIALLDGDLSDSGCGALAQAGSVCVYDSCLSACPRDVPASEVNACVRTAFDEACSAYIEAASCVSLPRYTRCQQGSPSGNFSTYGDLFCGSGSPTSPGAGGDAGVGGAPQ